MLIYYKKNQYQKKKKLKNLSFHIASRKDMNARPADNVCVRVL